MFENCKWIWINNEDNADEYADFYADFELSELGGVKLDIAVDGNFEMYLNGEFCAFGTCSDYPNDKFYDSFSLDEHCIVGKNSLKITVWHIGMSSSTYVKADAGLIFSVSQSDRKLVYSDARILSRKNESYTSGLCRWITGQLGPTYRYDNTAIATLPLSASVEVERNARLSPRGIENLVLLPRIPVIVHDDGKRLLIDWGEETAGYLDLDFDSDGVQELRIVFGEHLDNEGKVPRFIGTRDFSIDFVAKEGDNRFFGGMRRIAGRYLEIEYEKPLTPRYIGILPVLYPVTVKEKHFSDPVHKQIYDTSVRTLQCCMHEHYEDCPWREQALYSLDSRNQMLCGYFAFEEYRYARFNIMLLAKSLHNGLLRITSPTDKELPIPFFSLTFIQQVFEYVKFSGDRSIIDEASFALDEIIQTFISKIDESRLIPAFPAPAWNFYEWSEGNEGYHRIKCDGPCYDLCLNAMFLYVLPMYEALRGETCVDKNAMVSAMKDRLFDSERGLFKNTIVDGRFSVIGNALAILAGAGGRELADKLVEERGCLTDLTLSMNGYFYDALLSVDESYKEYILTDMIDKYSYMLEEGATTFWETIEGWHAFGDAGSLCHGWSALPVYYFHVLGCIEE